MNNTPDFSDDIPILRARGAARARLIGYGGEARVYARDEASVIRLLHPGASLQSAQARTRLLAEIAIGARHLPFATPEIEGITQIEDRIVVTERRLPGVPFSLLLGTAGGEERRELLEAYFQTAARIREIEVRRDYFGDLIAEPPVQRTRYRTYLRDRIAQTRAITALPTDMLSDDLADAIPDCSSGALVHFDLFPGNVLIEHGSVSAVIDFGATAMIADPRLDLWSAAAYLDPAISPNATEADRAFANDWLAARGLASDFKAARRWIAGYWCFAQDDPKVMDWCRRVLSKRA